MNQEQRGSDQPEISLIINIIDDCSFICWEKIFALFKHDLSSTLIYQILIISFIFRAIILNSVIRRFQENTLKHYLKWEWHFEFKIFSLVMLSFGGIIFSLAVHNVGR
jgi:hypothetical protein